MAIITESNASLAVIIDADNAQASIIEGLLSEIAKFGVASVKRIYGDWTTPNLGQWKTVLLNHSIQPIQQFRYTTGKNATDSAMIIDAMDLLYSGNFDGFCIVSSDSDFTRLASRIRESGKSVYGFGEKKTPQPFVAACDRFVYTEVFTTIENAEKEPSKIPGNKLRQDTQLMNLFRSAIAASSDEDGWANLSSVGSNIVKQAPDFDPRNYHYEKLSDLAVAIDYFEMNRKEQKVLIKDSKKK
jgi:uncharacterized LabA/DUF88 family protein